MRYLVRYPVRFLVRSFVRFHVHFPVRFPLRFFLSVSLYVFLLRTSLTCPLYLFTVLTVTMFFEPDERHGGQRDRREAERHDVGSVNIDAYLG